MEFNIEDLRVMPTEVIKEKLDKQSEGLDYLDKLCSELKSENKVMKKMINIIIENYINVTQELIENDIIEGSILTDVGFEIVKKEIYDEARRVAEKEVKDDPE